MVEEKNGEITQTQSWSYMKQEGISQILSAIQSSLSDGFSSSCSSGSQNVSISSTSNNAELVSPVKNESNLTSIKLPWEKFSNVSLKSNSGKLYSSSNVFQHTASGLNDAFDGIGDDDL